MCIRLSPGKFEWATRLNSGSMGRMKINLFLKYLVAFLFCCLIARTAGAQNQKALLLFGGEKHDEFLGCLNCNSQSAISVCNEFGKYGSKYQSDSIWNEYGKYGSQYNALSPWDEYSSTAPIIVDKDGTSYGYFSANSFHHDRTNIDWLVKILDFQAEKGDLDATRELMCSD